MRNFKVDNESGNQEALFAWAACNVGRMPELEYLLLGVGITVLLPHAQLKKIII